jgi:hypothetical protein
MRTHVGTWPINEYVAQDGSRTFLIKRENSGGWSVWCKVGSANLAFANNPSEKITFETPEHCVALFRDQSGFEREWTDFMHRIHAYEGSNAPKPVDVALGDSKTWIGPGEGLI